MAYRFEITDLPAGRTRFTHGPHEADSERALARKLVQEDAPDGPVTAVRGADTAWTAPSLHRLAATTLSEGDAGFSRGIYAPDPRHTTGPMHPALEHAIFRERERRRMASEARAGRGVAAPITKPAGGA